MINTDDPPTNSHSLKCSTTSPPLHTQALTSTYISEEPLQWNQYQLKHQHWNNAPEDDAETYLYRNYSRALICQS